jgi:hypothetical protein
MSDNGRQIARALDVTPSVLKPVAETMEKTIFRVDQDREPKYGLYG